MSAGKLPEGWVPCKLGDTLLKIVGGGTPSKAIPEYYQGDIPWMSVKDMNKHTLTDTVDHITPDAVKNSSTNIIPAGIPIIATRMSLGKIVTASFDSAINQDLKALFLANGIERNFFLHWYRSQAQLIENLGTGTTVKGIRLEVLNSLSMNLPPLTEQKIIAEKLDTLLAQVDSTKARLEQIPQILKRFRQAVLRAAMNGTLMGLKESRPHPLCKQWQWPEVPSTWSVLTYSELVDSRLGKMLDKVKNIGSPIKYLGNVNVRWFSFNLENLQEILISESERSELILKYGDILICEGGEPGRCAIWTESDKTPIVFQKALHRARVREKIIPEWLVLNLKNDSNNLTLSQLFTGTTIKHLTGKALAKYPLRVPPVYEQREIVRRVEQLFAYADTIEKQVNNALARVNNLTQSILAKAFRGELTAQWRAENPDLISGENSAAALLEKIKAERAASGGKKASRKKS
ncbi:restriction endonuclease subunit S [Escherichia albertii]|uniref:Restriction endonuclease subunit S n=1 Tax=Escherichia albertii TaxID=208962 RepID=A0ABX5HDK5_ESCAL|nr:MULTISPECIES: restriction endonuclease subunit S [Escherichia]EFF0781383.1 restriction endonuclease subunit S [Escherichia albertii]EFO0998660.1 restriction endonuclease subunit S [Escherichia albertii]ELY3285732.1 restriction endonuclease subunit S [Escherichia albertii]MCU7307960.1 restriction endonuclease subunit S [Escherichia albertii]MCZ8630120.1 restriction endonuclease subunit S [Escherichia albertii]